MRTVLAAVAGMALAVVGAVTPSARPAGAAVTTTSAQMVQQIIQDINAERVARGIPALPQSTIIDNMEQQVSDAQAAGTIPYGDYVPNYQSYGFQSGIIVSSWGATVTGGVVAGFMGSTGHRNSIMSNAPDMAIGVGVTCGGTDKQYVQVGLYTTSSAIWYIPSTPSTPEVTNPDSGTACPDPITTGGGTTSTSTTFPDPSYPVVGMAANGSQGYWLANSDGQVWSHGTVGITNISTLDPVPTVGIASTSTGNGLAVVDAQGHVFTYGDMVYHGDVTWTLNAPVLGITLTPDDKGYWLVAADGGIFSFGDAHFWGSMGGKPLNKPVVGMAPTLDNKGYWLVAADGGIFSFGDAVFHGSTGNLTLNKPVIGMTVSADGLGYRLVASDGGIFSFGDAQFYGSMGGKTLAAPVVGMATTADSKGYWMVAADGGIFSFGDAHFYGAGS